MKKIVALSILLTTCSSFAQSIVQPAYDTLRKEGYHDVYRLVHNNENCPSVDYNGAIFQAINPQGHIAQGIVCNGRVYENKSTQTNGVLVLK